jgi:hypothetical protein
MVRHRRLYRPEIYQELARISRKWSRLNYPRFCIQSMYDMNPDHINDPDMNFSHAEAVRGFLSPKPLTYRKGDLRLFLDSLGRPDKYAIEKLKREIGYWNQKIANRLNMVYVFSCEVEEIIPATARKEETRNLAIYDYLRVLRGRDFVSHVEGHIDGTIGGLEERKEWIQDSVDGRKVDRAVRTILTENERIQNG